MPGPGRAPAPLPVPALLFLRELGPSLSSSRGLTLGVAPRAKLGARAVPGALKSRFTRFGEMNFSFCVPPGQRERGCSVRA